MNAIRLLAIPVILSMVLVGCNPSTSSQPTETDVPAARLISNLGTRWGRSFPLLLLLV